MILFIFGIIFATVNGQYLVFDGKCPDISPPKDSIYPEGSFYGIAETTNGTTRSDIVIVNKFEDSDGNLFESDEAFRNSDEDCDQILSALKKVDNGKYKVISSLQGDDKDSFGGYLVYYLSKFVTFICFDTEDESQFNAKVIVLSSDPEEFDSDRRKEVEDLLESNDLGYLNEYLSPVKQKNPCNNDLQTESSL